MNKSQLQTKLDKENIKVKVIYCEHIGPDLWWIVCTDNPNYNPDEPIGKRFYIVPDEEFDILASDYIDAINWILDMLKRRKND